MWERRSESNSSTSCWRTNTVGMGCVWKNYPPFGLLLPQKEGILNLQEIEKTGPKEESAVWRRLHKKGLPSAVTLFWKESWQEEEKDLLAGALSVWRAASVSSDRETSWEPAGKRLPQLPGIPVPQCCEMCYCPQCEGAWTSVSFHSAKPEDTQSREVGMHDRARGGIIVCKVNVFLENKRSHILHTDFLENILCLSLLILTKWEHI